MALRTVLLLIGTGGITSTYLGAGAVTETALAAGAVTTGKIADNAVDAAKINNGSITASDMDLTGTYDFTDLKAGGVSVATSASNVYYAVVDAVATSDVSNPSTGAPNSVDGFTIIGTGKKLLLPMQSDNSDGIYQVDSVGSGSNGQWSRPSDRNEDAELPIGLLVYDKNRQKLWKLTGGSLASGLNFEEHQEGLSPLESSGEPSQFTGDGTKLNFDLSASGVVSATVFVDGLEQDPGVWSISAGSGPGGVDQLSFTSGNAPANGAKIELVALVRS